MPKSCPGCGICAKEQEMVVVVPLESHRAGFVTLGRSHTLSEVLFLVWNKVALSMY